MPAILTHDLFGRGVLEDVTDLLGLRSVGERDAFLLGNQGPDPLFYLVVDPLMHKWSPLGNALHGCDPAALLVAMREAALRLEGHERQLARAYVAGFACHWLLDSTMHPFVYWWQNGITSAGVPGLDESAGSRVHAEIERDFDEMALYALTGKTVERWRPHERVLQASRDVLAAVDKVYFYLDGSLWTVLRADQFTNPGDPVPRDIPRGYEFAGWVAETDYATYTDWTTLPDDVRRFDAMLTSTTVASGMDSANEQLRLNLAKNTQVLGPITVEETYEIVGDQGRIGGIGYKDILAAAIEAYPDADQVVDIITDYETHTADSDYGTLTFQTASYTGIAIAIE